MRIMKAIILTFLTFSSQLSAQIFPSVVDELDLNSYLGTWYEVASTKPFFQEGCVCVTADYSLQDDGNVKVVNTCRKDSVDSPAVPTVGEAQVTDNPAKFKVSFGNIPAFFANYWVVGLADDYSWAVVSSGFRNPIWILSRTPELSSDTLDTIKEALKRDGFDTQAISPTVQDGCW